MPKSRHEHFCFLPLWSSPSHAARAIKAPLEFLRSTELDKVLSLKILAASKDIFSSSRFILFVCLFFFSHLA